MTRPLTAASLVILLAACAIPEEGPMMDPGEDCLECHGGATGGGGEEEEEEDGPAWTLAGTVYPSETADAGSGVRGASISVRDANGKSFTLRSNKAGNFYTAESLAFPLEVRVNGELMPPNEPGYTHGSCNFCHRPGRDGWVIAH